MMMMIMMMVMTMMMMMMMIMPISLPGEGADAAVQAVVLLIDGASLHTARDLLPLLLPLLLVRNLEREKISEFCLKFWVKISHLYIRILP